MGEGRPDNDVLLVGDGLGELQRPLVRHGYRVKRARTGGKALDALAGEDFLVVLIDLETEDLETHELIQRVHEEQPHVALVLVADPARSHLVMSALCRGVDAFVPEPVDFAFLVERIERQVSGALRRWASLDEDEDGLFVDGTEAIEWEGPTRSQPPEGAHPKTAESHPSLPSVSRVPVDYPQDLLPDRVGGALVDPEGTIRQPKPGLPAAGYDPKDFPPEVHDVPTGPVPALRVGAAELDEEAATGPMGPAPGDEAVPAGAPIDAVRDELSGMLKARAPEVEEQTRRISIQVTNPGAIVRVGEDGSLSQDLGAALDEMAAQAAAFDEDEETRTLAELDEEERASEPSREVTRHARPRSKP